MSTPAPALTSDIFPIAAAGQPHVLAALIADVPVADIAGATDVVVDHFGQDSRGIGPGALFVATRGTHWDGHVFIDRALAQGARVVIAEAPAPADLRPEVTWVRVPDGTSMAALARISAAWFGHPGRDVKVLATTGTNGKTTTTFLLSHILMALGHRVGLVSTVEVRIGDRRAPTIFTTPPAPEFQGLLAAMRDDGCRFAAVEASSHGLHQQRIAAFRVAVAGFSNLTRDHLDYHQTMEAYEAAKAILFEELAERACFNVDDPVGRRFAAAFRGEKLRVSARPEPDGADLWTLEASYGLDGTRATIAARPGLVPGDRLSLSFPLIGSHNLQNVLLALGMAMLAGMAPQAVVEALRNARGAPGRLQKVASSVDATEPAVFVDYAHSPDALANVLVALRSLLNQSLGGGGRLVVVFGAGGDRDRGKRPQMAAVAAAHADFVWVTSDNPRTEDPAAIIADIVAGFPATGAFASEPDRARAIQQAIADAAESDVVLIAGKGHEDYQIVGTTKHPFDDVEVARAALLARAADWARRPS